MDIELPTSDQVMARLPQWRAAHAELATFLEHYGDPVRALRHMGLVLWQKGDFSAALPMLAGATALSPEDAALWSGLGGVLFAAGHRAEAAGCLEKALARNPSSATDWLMLGTIFSGEADGARAEAAFLNALRHDTNSAEAAMSLGLLYTRRKRYGDAVACLSDAVARGIDTPALYTCLGQACFNLGDFAKGTRAFAEAVHRQPDDLPLRDKYGQARFIEAVLNGSGLADALSLYEAAAGHPPDGSDKLIRDTFHILSGYGHHDAAIRLGEAHLALKPGDPVQTYLMDALQQAPIDRAPRDYVQAYFDQFAESFDRQLVEVLDYRGHETLYALVAEAGKELPRVLDLGCGTGLAGPLLKTEGRTLTGVDLSQGMLEKARLRGAYTDLIAADALDFLASTPPASFDLIFIADMLIYIGDLTALMREAARVLPPGGLLALTIETISAETFQLLPSGRFAHRPAYLVQLAQSQFILRHHQPTMIRLEAGRPVDGALMLFERA